MNDISYITWNAMSDDYIAQKIGSFIKYHRLKQNKTQDILAREAGISRSTLSLLERGQVVTVATLIQVLRILDQLQVFDNFFISNQVSPLLLAKIEKNKRQRATSTKRRKTDNGEEADW